LAFFEGQDLLSQYKSLSKKRELVRERKAKEEKIKQIKHSLNELNNPKTLEKYAREKYYFKRDNEDLFVIVRK